jgi:hypothetical protein
MATDPKHPRIAAAWLGIGALLLAGLVFDSVDNAVEVCRQVMEFPLLAITGESESLQNHTAPTRRLSRLSETSHVCPAWSHGPLAALATIRGAFLWEQQAPSHRTIPPQNPPTAPHAALPSLIDLPPPAPAS